MHQVSLGICAFRHLHNNDNAHSFSLRSSAPELQGHCRGAAKNIDLQTSSSTSHLDKLRSLALHGCRHGIKQSLRLHVAAGRGEWLRVQCQGIGASNGCGEPEPFVRGSIQPRPLLLNSQVVPFLILNRLNLSASSYICKRISRRILWSKGHPHLISFDLT